MGQGLLHVRRLKGGTDSTHPLRGPELRALRRLQRENAGDAGGSYVFCSERKGPLTASTVRKLVARAGMVIRLLSFRPYGTVNSLA